MIDFSKVRLLIVDLDNTICDTFHTISKRQWNVAAKALAAKGYTSEAKIVNKSLGKHSFKQTIIAFPKQAQRIALRAYDSVGVQSLKLYSDAQAILDLPVQKVLVTRGEPSLQNRKIRHLEIRKHFKKVYCVPTMERKGKAFKRILKEFRLKPKQALIIGDRIEEEIKDGNDLGIPAVLVRRPDWPIRKNAARPDLVVRSLFALAKKIHV